MNANPDLEILAGRYLDGLITCEDLARLNDCLRSDPQARREFAEMLNLDSALAAAAAEGTKETKGTDGTDELAAAAAGWQGEKNGTAGSKIAAFPHLRRWLGIAACLALLAGGAWWWLAAPQVFATVQQVHGLAGLAVGTKLGGENHAITSGSLELITRRGAQVVIEAPAVFHFASAQRLVVTRGRISAEVPPPAHGFTVETEQTQVVDLGTKFGVDVTESGHTDVVVFQGKVELFERKTSGRHKSPMTQLVEGEAVRVDAHQQLSRIVNVTSGARDGEWTTRDNERGAGVIASVRDNLRDPLARGFYHIVPGGLCEDARAFVGQRHEWNGFDAAGIPPWLLGADLVQTILHDRFKTSLEITVTVARPAVVYVLFDSRYATPSWLAENFTDTGARIGLENAPTLDSGRPVGKGPGVGSLAPFAVWKRELPQAGSLTLGPPRQTTDERIMWMYGIAVKPL